MICCSRVNCHRLTARLYLSSVVLSNCLRCCDSGEDGGLVTDQGIQAGDIPPGQQIHPGLGVKNAAPRCCSAADEWSYLSCHEGSAGEVTAQLYLVSSADAFTREETEKQKRGRERETNPAPSSTSSVPPEPISLPIIPQSCCPERRLWHIYMFFLLTFQRPFCQRL